MENPNQEQPQTAGKEASSFTRMLKFMAVPLSAVVGGIYTHSFVRNKSYDNLKARGAFASEYKSLNESARALMPEWGAARDIKNELRALDAVYSARVDQRIADLGYSGIIDRFKNLHRNQKLEAGLLGFTAAGITLGVILTLADHKSLLERLGGHKHDEQGNVR